jgi:hypothetical protein
MTSLVSRLQPVVSVPVLRYRWHQPEVSILSDGVSRPSPSHDRMACACSGLLDPLRRPPSLRLGYPASVGRVGLTQLTSGKPRMQEDGTCSPVGIESIGRGAAKPLPFPQAFWHCLAASLAASALRAVKRSFTRVHPLPPPRVLSQMRLRANGPLSPELHTLDDSAACLGRGTWMPQGPVLGTSLLVLVGFDGVQPSRSLVATQRSGGWRQSVARRC